MFSKEKDKNPPSRLVKGLGEFQATSQVNKLCEAEGQKA